MIQASPEIFCSGFGKWTAHLLHLQQRDEEDSTGMRRVCVCVCRWCWAQIYLDSDEERAAAWADIWQRCRCVSQRGRGRSTLCEESRVASWPLWIHVFGNKVLLWTYVCACVCVWMGRTLEVGLWAVSLPTSAPQQSSCPQWQVWMSPKPRWRAHSEGLPRWGLHQETGRKSPSQR